ncbi:MAG: DUF1573 domain-containing protein [Chitinophagales bacterium]|jgi:hypothetical protein|nr:DUF1573 domain-containing protein [Chitinophagales bacterium]
MKYFFIFSIILLGFQSCQNANSSSSDAPKIDTVLYQTKTLVQFKDTFFDLGEVFDTGKVKIVYQFTNVGQSPLVIKNVKSTCGCTVPSYNNQPIPPNATDSIIAYYDAVGKEGPYRKTIQMFANTKEESHDLSFKITVNKKK